MKQNFVTLPADSILGRSVAGHIRALREGEYTSEALTSACLERIREVDPTVGAFLAYSEELALRSARASDERRRRGEEKSALDGIPFAVKDNLCTKDFPTTCASKILEDWLPPYDAEAVTRLRDAGCVLIGKLNMDEFGMGSSTENSAYRPTRNPHDPARVPGGSSGGSAAAVAASEVPFALGSDTGGSVRQPASFCGVVGLRPEYGRISRSGLIAFAPSLDCVGLLTKTAEDCGILLSVLSGKDEADATSINASASAVPSAFRVALAENFENLCSSADVRAAVLRASEIFGAHGTVGSAKLPSPDEALAAYCVISSTEAASVLSRFDGIRYGKNVPGATADESIRETRGTLFGKEVRCRILFGTLLLSEENRERYLSRANEARKRVTEALENALADDDLLLLPTAPATAFKIGEKRSPAESRRDDLCQVYAALSGLPALSVPVGTDAQGLPIGVQLIGRRGGEATLLAAAKLLSEVSQ